uniref:B-cell receptor CD22 n=1 Tax=Paramormyrops kingsleyae TaxID=1676925 RepID=A0A3B3T7K4_9TELE
MPIQLCFCSELYLFSDAQSQNGWIVQYPLQSICIMTGNSVDIPCWYQNPSKQKVYRTFWYRYKDWMPGDKDPKDLAYDPEYRDRVEYLGDKNHSCAFRIKQLKREDSDEYRFRFITYWDERYTVAPGVTLSVTGKLQLEGNSVILICRSNATASENNYKWYKKNGIHAHETKSSKTLIIKDIKPEHSGHYFCGIWSITSTEVYINVQYAPKNISVIAFPSVNLKERDSVTLTCGAKANPEVERYTWFKKNGEKIIELGTGNNYTITNITSKDSGPYYCSGENRHGTINSTYLSVNVQYAPREFSVSVSPSGGIMMGDSVTLTCSGDANPPAKSYQWFKDEILISPGVSGQNYTINNIKFEHNGRYKCNATNDIGSHFSPAVFIFVESMFTSF